MPDLLATLKQAGFKGPALKTAWAIAQRESGGKARAFNPDDSTGDKSYGLFQINMLNELGPARRKQFGLRSNEDLYDPATNARVAFQMSKGGRDFGAWGVGPNAYRKTAPLDLSGFPGGGGPGLPPRGSAFKLPDFKLDLAEADGGLPDFDFDPGGGDEGGFEFTPLPTFARASMPPGAGGFGESPSLPPAPVQVPKGSVNVNAWTGHGTHITDGLDLNHGQKTAVDIMAKPGTAVPAPASGTVVRLGSAQGGDSMYFRDDNGKMWWLGHIDSRYSLPPGTRVQAGQTLSRISADHRDPHLHLDRTL